MRDYFFGFFSACFIIIAVLAILTYIRTPAAGTYRSAQYTVPV
ncbi:hypothetical protein [Bradyrhizobium sp. ORS 285]|nr:hypothetical protein [Bradyrhizobium sp. ORS 285]